MATVPNQRSWTSGYKVTAADLNSNVRDAVNFLLAPPSARVHQATPQSIPNGAYTAIAMDTADLNNDSMWSSGANTRLTAQTAGAFRLIANGSWAANATGTRRLIFEANGSVVAYGDIRNAVSGGAQTSQTITFEYFLNIGDYVQVFGFQDSGGALSLTGTTSFSATWIGTH